MENQKVLLDKVGTLKYVVDSLMTFVSIENFSWCREEMNSLTGG